MSFSEGVLPWVIGLTIILWIIGLGWIFAFVPPDYQQRETVLILFIHVPAAMLAVNTYILMCIACAVGLVRRQPLSFFLAQSCAPIGAVFTVLALITGAFWGAPMWGTWWVWDARLTSILILLFFYIGYIVLGKALEDTYKVDELTSIFCLVGSVFALMSRYATLFLSTLHQGASLSLDAETNVDDAYYWPLLVMIAAYYGIFLTLLFVGMRTRIRARQIQVWQMGRSHA